MDKTKQATIGYGIFIVIFLAAGGVYACGALFELHWIDPFYTSLSGFFFFSSSAIMHFIAWREGKKNGKTAQPIRAWPPGTKKIFLITGAFLLVVAVAFWWLFIRG